MEAGFAGSDSSCAGSVVADSAAGVTTGPVATYAVFSSDFAGTGASSPDFS